MNISQSVFNLMIQHLSIAAHEARKNADMFATFQGDFSDVINQFKNEAEQLEHGIDALILENTKS